MPSIMIHMAIANNVNKKLNINQKELYLGTIAPDISKQIGETKEKTHFQNENGLCNIDLFIKKYRSYLSNPFELGYFMHLLIDNLWVEQYLPNYINSDILTLNDGTELLLNDEDFSKILYNDYTNLNSKLLSYYNMDLSLFYESFTLPNIYIEEITKEQLPIIIDKMGLICSKTAEESEYILDIKSIIHFIEYSTIYLLDIIKDLNIKFN